MPINPENESSYLFELVRKFGLASVAQERIVHIPCEHPGGERKSKGKATNYRHRLYTIAKWLRTHGDANDRIAGEQFRSNWKLTLEPDETNSFWYVVLTPASLDPERQMLEEMWASALQQLEGTDPREARQRELESLANLEPSASESAPVDSNQLFRKMYNVQSEPDTNASDTAQDASQDAPEPAPDPSTLSDAELHKEIEAYLAADQAIPPELDAEAKRRRAK